MACLVLIGIGMACWLSVCVRVALLHPAKTACYAVRDLVDYIRFKKWRNCASGTIKCFIGLFGKGKTLSAVHHVIGMYRRYDGLEVYDPFRKKWVVQKVHVVSNVELRGIPYERLVSLSQIVSIADSMRERDELAGTLTATIVLGDEFSVQLNSRNFKSNIDPLFLNTLLTCRHHRISLVYTSQRFNHVDALLRQVTSCVVSCNKVWRLMVHGQYDAYELENASAPTMVKPLRRYGWFVSDADFDAYDTLACVDNLSRSCLAGDMLSEAEILALQQHTPSDMDSVTRPSRRYFRNQKKKGK